MQPLATARARALETLDRFGYAVASRRTSSARASSQGGRQARAARRGDALRRRERWAPEYEEAPPLVFHAAYRWLTSEQMLKLLGAVEYAEVEAA